MPEIGVYEAMSTLRAVRYRCVGGAVGVGSGGTDDSWRDLWYE